MERQPTSMLKIGPFPSLDVTISASKNNYCGFASNVHENKDDKILVWDEKGGKKIAQMFISYDEDYIKSLAFQYVEEDGNFTLSPIFGCQNLDGPNFETMTFKEAGDNEYITRVSGSHNTRGLNTLTIETNVATYGPFGSADRWNNKKFQMGLGHGDQFGGFHGTSCSSPKEFITSIGVYLKPIQDLGAPTNKNNHDDLSIH